MVFLPTEAPFYFFSGKALGKVASKDELSQTEKGEVHFRLLHA